LVVAVGIGTRLSIYSPGLPGPKPEVVPIRQCFGCRFRICRCRRVWFDGELPAAPQEVWDAITVHTTGPYWKVSHTAFYYHSLENPRVSGGSP
jgi:hypothetical protein